MENILYIFLQNQHIRKRAKSSTFLQYDNMYGLYGDELEQMVHFNQSVEMVFQVNSSTFNFSSIVCAINVIASSFLTSLWLEGTLRLKVF